MREAFLAGSLLMVLFTAGCNVEEYNISIRNTGSAPITEAHVIYDGFRSAGGNIQPGGGGVHLLPDYPIPDRATVEWRTADGQTHRTEVEVRKLIPKGFRGDIQFGIAEDNTVTVRVVPREKLQL